jgi:outer membrane receptor protein involved in Fe transport
MRLIDSFRGGWAVQRVAKSVFWTPVLLALAFSSARAQTIRGRVVAAHDGTPLADVSILVSGGSSTITGANGMFRVSLPSTTAILVATRLGFLPESVSVTTVDTAIVIRMQPAPLLIDPIVIAAERALTAASSSVVRELDIRLRPRNSSQELLRLAPGLVIAQHAGGGKAEQIFLRGFDADHGTDVAITVDGAPVNMVSHAHGQGYADLHFVMPEIVSRLTVRKGPYDAADGDFATAGAVSFETVERLGSARVEMRGGSFDTGNVFAALPFGGDVTGSGGYLASSFLQSRGPFETSQAHRRGNAFFKWSAPVSDGAEIVASASGFGAKWNASGQIPERALASGMIGRFGALDATEGGRTSRFDARVALRSRDAHRTQWQAQAFASKYDFQLWSNFTFFLNDTVNGDGIEQVDDRVLLGVRAEMARLGNIGGKSVHWSAGVGSRSDRANIALHHQVARQRLDTYTDHGLGEDHVYAWVKQEFDAGERLRLQAGFRADAMRFSALDRQLADVSADAHWYGIVSPKLNVAYRIADGATLFANAGTGFHSNDARSVMLRRDAAQALPRAVGSEMGLRYSWSTGSVSAAGWLLDLQSETVWVGDEGTTEPSGATRRLGLDSDARVRVASWLWADADLNLSHGRFRGAPANEERVPLAPSITSVGGLTVRDAGPLSGGIRYRFVGSRPADESNIVRARAATIFESFVTATVGRTDIVLTADNLFNVDWNEAQFATTSRLRGESREVTELHFTPGAPRAIQLGVRVRLN